MSQISSLATGGGGGSISLTGDVGGAVSPTLDNINLVGGAGVTVTGNPGTSTLTITGVGGGTVVSVSGGTNINVTGTGADPIVNLDDTVSISGSMTAGTGFTATTGDVVVTSGKVTLPTTSATDGQITINGTRVLHTYGGNNFFGAGAGNFTTTGLYNTACGGAALEDLTSGEGNVAMGGAALQNLTSGDDNMGSGGVCLQDLTTGVSNLAIGSRALRDLLTGNFNICIGSGSKNTVGIAAGELYTSSESDNICIGHMGVAGDNNKIRIGQQGTGDHQQNTTYIVGIYNTAVGATAGIVLSDSVHKLGGLAGAANTVLIGGTKPSFTGSPSVSGSLTAATNITATAGYVDGDYFRIDGTTFVHNNGTAGNESNVFVGEGAGAAVSGSGGRNVGVGKLSLNALTGGDNNTAIGWNTLKLITTGNTNSAFGCWSLDALTSGDYNTALGANSLSHLVSGIRNLGIRGGGSYTGAESSNIVIGAAGTVGESNKIHIGAQGTGNDQQDACYIAGIYNTAPTGGSDNVVVIDSNGQLGAQVSLDVANGGSGAGTFTDHGILLGSGTSAITATAAPTNGQLLIGDTGNDPSLATLTAGTGITVTNAAHSVTVASTGTTVVVDTSTAKTLVIGEAGKFITMSNAGAITLTIPLHSSVAFETGVMISFQQLGAGQITITPTGGVSLHSADSAYKTVKQYSGGCIVQTAEDQWGVFGDMEA